MHLIVNACLALLVQLVVLRDQYLMKSFASVFILHHRIVLQDTFLMKKHAYVSAQMSQNAPIILCGTKVLADVFAQEADFAVKDIISIPKFATAFAIQKSPATKASTLMKNIVTVRAFKMHRVHLITLGTIFHVNVCLTTQFQSVKAVLSMTLNNVNASVTRLHPVPSFKFLMKIFATVFASNVNVKTVRLISRHVNVI